jgi:hypothetical protein
LLLKIENLLIIAALFLIMEPILLEQFSVPEDTDYGKHKNNDTWNDGNPASYSFFGPTRNGS